MSMLDEGQEKPSIYVEVSNQGVVNWNSIAVS
jgi:hypothetical protein